MVQPEAGEWLMFADYGPDGPHGLVEWTCPPDPDGYLRRSFWVEEAVARAEVERLRGVVRVVESEHYRVFSPEEPPEGGCICMAYPCPELEALDVLAALEEGDR